MEELELFYNRLCLKNKYYCLNYKADYGFSKNTFIKNYEELKEFFIINANKNCYINYQPLLTTENRKTENVLGVNVIALDIECLNKQSPELEDNMRTLKTIIGFFIDDYRIKNYLLVNSGNGYHLYLFIGDVIKKETDELKLIYYKMLDNISSYLTKKSNNFLKCDDRKDLAGILRIPGTLNTKANRTVKIEIDRNEGDNIYLRKLFFEMSFKVKSQNKMLEQYSINLEQKYKNIPLPKNIDELIDNPLVRIWFDKNLQEPKYGNWHNSIIFALQAIIYHSGLQKRPEILELSREINKIWGTSSDLSTCSYKKDLYFPINSAIKFCDKNNYLEYKKALEDLYIKKKDL